LPSVVACSQRSLPVGRGSAADTTNFRPKPASRWFEVGIFSAALAAALILFETT
jgi:hypothetical protein